MPLSTASVGRPGAYVHIMGKIAALITDSMWLLSTRNLQLVYFNGPADVPGGYAILSHVWQAKEQSFQDIKQLQPAEELEAQAYVSPDDDRLFDERFCPKIRGCVRTARDYGLDWVWIDTCCIDKTSSAEIQEAINSMFRCGWRRIAPHSAKSKWFTRGWTLQELIAPMELIFMSTEWMFLGSKACLARLLEEITSVDAQILNFYRKLDDVSVARRMSWASTRQTTRLEDQAYSLLGIFGISMPTIYGEGEEAFRRLQEEIMKRSSDRTLLVWGTYLTPPTADAFRDTEVEFAYQFWLIKDKPSLHPLFARSPSDFAQSALIVPLTLSELLRSVQLFRVEVPDSNLQDFYADIVTTGRGSRCHWPIIRGERISIALLPCASGTGHCIGLVLSMSPPEPKDHIYHIGASGLRGMSSGFGWVQASEACRLVEINAEFMQIVAFANTGFESPTTEKPLHRLSTLTDKLSAPIKAIYIKTYATTSPAFEQLEHAVEPRTMSPYPRLHIPAHVLRKLAIGGFRVKAWRMRRLPVISSPCDPSIALGPGSRFLAIPFLHEFTSEAFFVVLIQPNFQLLRFLVDIVIFPSKPCLDWNPIASAYCALGLKIPWCPGGRNIEEQNDVGKPPWEGLRSNIRFGRGFLGGRDSRACQFEAGNERRRVQGTVTATVPGREAILQLSVGGSVFNALGSFSVPLSMAPKDLAEDTCLERQVDQGEVGRHRKHAKALRSPAESEVEAAAFATPFTVAGLLQLHQEENPLLQRPHSLTDLFWIELSCLLQSALLLPDLWSASFKPTVARRSSRRSRSLDSRPHIFNPEGLPMKGACDISLSVPIAMH
ncbi:hypothetical protein NUW54_g4461 [Trametes sanguinea]|uniref:Uncharacterized protein n=1 Tax=Trametes sanguinea TaxID=158606 RepID=A0ACC1PYX6_9APHY|nr:hypothetical protein NUW54_g4461 [Trametes sanguinea]